MMEEAERQKRLQAKLLAEKQARLEAQQAEQERLKREAQEAERIRAQREAEEAARLQLERELAEKGKRLQKAESTSRLKKREEEDKRAEAERRAKYELVVQKTERPQTARPQTARPQTASKSSPQLPISSPKFGFLRRRKGDESPSSPESQATAGRSRQSSNAQKEAHTIRPGGGGAIPGTDAPISAVNAGDRRVMVECNQSHILLPVTPTTTPQDLIRSASTCLSEPINVKTAVLLESFSKVGVQRPLRNYEHVRDVMNSWDDDKQNALIIVDLASSDIDQQDLIASQVPETRPEEMSCWIHYSQKPGKWSKRYATLRSDGQIIVSKNESSKDSTNVCHLSDFDIYSPTQRKLAKVRPPKKYCYAIKSQQKSSMFMDESRFVHFFCSNDKNLASGFYRSVQRWRSWYLKNVMGEGQKKSKAAAPALPNFASELLARGNGASGHSRQTSVDSHYQLGSFMPLLDLDAFTKPKSARNSLNLDDAPLAKLDSKTMHMRKMSTRANKHPPLSYNLGTVTKDSNPQNPSRLNSLTQSISSHSVEAEPFAATGLLGRTYSQRQRAAQEREKSPSGPFTDGPSLLNHIGHSLGDDSGIGRKASVRSAHRRTSSDIQRSVSTRIKPKPLIDLTPQYQEPPQHARKGKGYVPEATGAGTLISSATSPEEAIKIPPSTDWRTRPGAGTLLSQTAHGGGAGDQRGPIRPGPNQGLAAYAANNHSGAPEDDSNAFTGQGLLSRSVGFNAGRVQVGRGVMDGSKAKGPMLDVKENTRFVPGSLLAGVERTKGSGGPVLDRE